MNIGGLLRRCLVFHFRSKRLEAEMKIFFALSLLVIYVSARFTITKIEADDQPCNVTFPLVSADFRSHFPERQRRAFGVMYWDGKNERFAMVGEEMSSSGGEVQFTFLQYYRQYNDKVNINPRTEFFISTDPTTGVVSCHKKEISTGINYRPPGIPNDYKCIGDFVQGWKDQSHNDGIKLKFCNKIDGNDYIVRTATSLNCFLVSHSNTHIGQTGHITILEETEFYGWQQDGPGGFPELPTACVIG